ncbi:MAG: FAD-dependent oxidoreductase [Acidobacteriota bacterium]
MTYTVVGGGLSGLVAAVALAREGEQVELFEHRSHLGGRGASVTQDGFTFNFGPHAIYKNGLTYKTLQGWGIELAGGSPQLSSNSFAVADGRLYKLPVGAGSLFQCGYLNAFEKLDFGNSFRKLTALDPETVPGVTVDTWLAENVRTDKARAMVLALVRLSTYSNAPEHLSLAASVYQLQLSGGGVVYLDGGWQSMIDALAGEAQRLGVHIRTGEVSAVRPNTILAVPPQEIERLTGVSLPKRRPARMACLDLGLTELPPGAALFALGVDQPMYLSVHSQWAKLATRGKALVQIGSCLREDEHCTRESLEAFADIAMPGWRDRIVHARFLPEMTVVHAITQPEPRIAEDVLCSHPGLETVQIAGDWVGSQGMLADACTASALRAARGLLQAAGANH